MSEAVFKYPGGKTRLFSWISDHIPTHRTWCDVFGGSGVVTANKTPSKVEVYNDLDGDLVHFFETLRDRPGDLAGWLDRTPHSRQLHERYNTAIYNGERPDNDVERAGRFFYLRFTQWGAKYAGVSGYNGSTKRSAPSSYRSAIDRLDEWADRFSDVQIERLDCVDLIERYDSPETLFYCDPPYMDEGDDLYSHSGAFDHGAFVDAVLAADGDWLVSYTRVPEQLHEAAVTVEAKDVDVTMRKGQSDWSKTNTERLVMNYDPSDRRIHSPDASCEDFL